MMKRTTTQTALGILLGAIILTQPALACMEDHDDWDYVEEPTGQAEPMAPVAQPVFECDQDMACPSGMLCEPVACLACEGCFCPAGVCEVPSTGAQGRDCEADADCGAGFECVSDTLEGCGDALGMAAEECHAAPLGWCEAQDAGMPITETYQIPGGLSGCQGGTDHGLPMSLVLFVLAAVVLRRRQVV